MLSGRLVPDFLVLSAPALGDGLPRWQHIVAPLIARIWPTLAFKNAWGPDVLSVIRRSGGWRCWTLALPSG